MIKRAILSVYDKTGIVELAKALQELGVEIVSTGGTARKLKENGIDVMSVSDVTEFPEILNGRVKTLHPKIHGGILARRDIKEHVETLQEHNITPIDMVVCNLYPFAATISRPDVTLIDALENIDIGGPTMIRATAKNFQHVVPVVDPVDYPTIISDLKAAGDVPQEFRRELAAKAFAHTAKYDGLISKYLADEDYPQEISLSFTKVQELRYGENPHQKAAVYANAQEGPSILKSNQLQGKPLSYNNINDADAALRMVLEFEEPTAVAVKHTNPCGVAVADDIFTAYQRAYEADSVSIFGGIVAVNRAIDKTLAEEMTKIFLEVILAPEFTAEAIEVFKKKKNLRLLQIENWSTKKVQQAELRGVLGGLLVQERDIISIEEEDWRNVTSHSVSEKQMADLHFAWKLCKHVKSNSIVAVKDGQTLGVGVGQLNRIDAARHAIHHGGEKCKGAVLASDAFMPFSDVVELAAEFGISAIAQPGGARRDNLSIEAAEKNGIAMIFTGTRHFKH